MGEEVGEVLAGVFLGIGADVVAVVDGKDVEAVAGKEGELGKMIEIYGEHEDPIAEGMFPRGNAGVGNGSFVDGRGHSQGSRFNISQQRVWAERMPSS